MSDREEYDRCIARGTHNERHGACVECGFEYRDFPEEEAEEARQRQLAEHEEITEVIDTSFLERRTNQLANDDSWLRESKAPYDWARESLPYIPITVSVVHDGTNKTQIAIERIQDSGAHVTVWDRPRGLRAAYLGCRSRLRRLSRKLHGDSGRA